MSTTEDFDPSTFTGIVFSKENALKGISAVINNSDILTKQSARLDEKIEKFAKKTAEDEVSGKFKQWRAKGKIEKAVRKMIMDSISMVTSFDSSVLGYALVYGRATLNALKDAKK